MHHGADKYKIFVNKNKGIVDLKFTIARRKAWNTLADRPGRDGQRRSSRSCFAVDFPVCPTAIRLRLGEHLLVSVYGSPGGCMQ